MVEIRYSKRPIKSRDLWKLLTKARQEGRLPPDYKIKQPYESNLETWQRLQEDDKKKIT